MDKDLVLKVTACQEKNEKNFQATLREGIEGRQLRGREREEKTQRLFESLGDT